MQNKGPPYFFISTEECLEFTKRQRKLLESKTTDKGNSMKLKIQAEDLLRGIVLDEAGWYPAVVEATEEKVSKAGDSNNCNVTFKLLAPEKYAGVKVFKTFSEKAPGIAAPFFVACGARTDDKGKLIPGEFDFKLTEGRKISLYIKQKVYEGRPQNDVADFRPLS